MHSLFKEYIEKTDKPKLSKFVLLNKKAVVQYCFNLDIVEWEDIRAEISKCCCEIKQKNEVYITSCFIFNKLLIISEGCKWQKHGGLGWFEQYNQESTY